MDGIVDLVNAAAGIEAVPAAAPPPLFPSDEKLVSDEQYRDLHPIILRVVSTVGAHLDCGMAGMIAEFSSSWCRFAASRAMALPAQLIR